MLQKIIYDQIYNKIPLNKKINALKNKEDEACYIFGDGKSIKYYNLQSFLIYHQYPWATYQYISNLNI